MRIKQEKEFKPVTITLETPGEVLALWDLLEGRELEKEQKQNFIKLCNWISNECLL